MNVFTRYHPRFFRTLVYMLQASEYDMRDYLAWYARTKDFAHVEKRKTIVWTSKAQVLYVMLSAGAALSVAGIVIGALMVPSTAAFLGAAAIVLAMPFVLPYLLAVLAMLVRFAQQPIEKSIVAIAQAKLAAHPALKIAIAGSYGKTTMREILKTVLSNGRKVAAPPGSYNTPLGIATFVNTLKGDEDVIIFELGEYYPGDIKRLCEIVGPNIGIVTGVNEAHLQKFGTLETTADTIFELADAVGERPLYINAENELARARAREYDTLFSREAVGVGADGWRVAGALSDLRGTTFRIVRGGEIIRVSSKLLGLHLVGPLAAAAAIAREIGLEIEEIEAGIRETKAFEHRMEMTVDNTGVITLDDSYNGNPDGARAVIEFLASISGHRRFYVTPGLVEMGARAEAVHREIGERLAQAGIEKVVLVETSVTPYIEEGLRASDYRGEVLKFPDMPTALTALVQRTVSGDVMLIQNDWPDQYA